MVVCPMELCVGNDELLEWSCNVRIAMNKLTVVACKAEEGAECLDGCWWFPGFQSGDIGVIGVIGVDSFGRDDMTEVEDTCTEKATLTRFHFETCRS